MSLDKVYFNKDIQVLVGDNTYYASVQGHVLQDEYDVYKTYTAITKIDVVDEHDNYVDLQHHPDSAELIQEIMDRDFEIEYEAEGLESWHDCLD